MTLLELKSSTLDIDFTIPGIDRIEFEQVLKNNPPGYRVDRWTDGHIYCQKLPKDYLEKKHQKAHNIQWITKFKCSKCGKEFDSSSNQLRFCDEDGMRIIAVKEKKP